MRKTLSILLIIYIGVGTATAAPISERTDTLPAAVVTDTRTNRHNLTPTAATRISAARLSASETVSIKELSATVPNFFMPDYAARTTAPVYIRGIGIKSDGTAAAFYVDGVPHYEPITFETDLTDVASIDVLRGPQGTLFGRSAMGGAINITTLSPFDRQRTRLRLGYGAHNDWRASASTSRTFGQKWGLALGAAYHHSDGFFTNRYDNSAADPMDETEESLGLYFRPTERLQLRLTSHFALSDQGGYAYAPYDAAADTLGTIAYNRASGFRRLVSTSGLNVTYTAPRFSLSSQTSFQYLNSRQRVDQDYTVVDKTYLVGRRHQNMFSEELTARSTSDSRYQWIIGAFAMHQHVDRTTNNQKPTAETETLAFYHQPTSSFALYHQSSLNLWRGLSASVGLRLDYEHTRSRYERHSLNHKKGTDEQTNLFDKSLDFTQLTPKFALQYETTRAYRFYALAARGYKPGGFNRSIASEAEQRYDPEYSWNYEMGAHLPLIAGRLVLDASLFYIDWRDTQLTFTYTGIGTLTTNAGHADSRGAELSLSATPAKGLRLDLAYGYTYARFVSYHKTDALDYSHHRLPMVPRTTLGLNAHYVHRPARWLDRLALNVSLNGLGSICWTEDGAAKQPFYVLLGAKFSLTKGPVTLALWGKNLTATRYLANVMTVSTGTFGQRGRGRMVGLSFQVEI